MTCLGHEGIEQLQHVVATAFFHGLAGQLDQLRVTKLAPGADQETLNVAFGMPFLFVGVLTRDNRLLEWNRIVDGVGCSRRARRLTANAGLLVDWSPAFAERFAGQPIKNVGVTVGDVTVRGDAMVTTAGLEGGPIYAVGRKVRARLDEVGACTVTIDLHPDQDVARLTERLANRRPKDSTTTWLRRTLGLHLVAVNLLREAAGPDLPSDPTVMAALVKAVPVRIAGSMPIDRAISTAGGVALDELDSNLMLRRRPGTFVAGEMIDWEAPTGGYLLQASFSTGVVAARGAAKWWRGGPDRSPSLTDDGR